MLARWIIENMPPHRCYVEPFGGGGSVLLRKPRVYGEVYNDLDGEMVNLFGMARDRGGELQRLLALTPFARDEFSASYTRSDDPLEQARRTLIRSFMGFGSNAHNRATGFRACSNRTGTTPAQDWQHYPDALEFTIERLRGVVLENRDAKEVMAAHDGENTLHYCDPPYVSDTRDRGSDYRFEMTDEDHEDLAAFLVALKGHVVISGYDCDLYRDLYAGWRQVRRASLADGARPREEVLWITAHSPSNELPLFQSP